MSTVHETDFPDAQTENFENAIPLTTRVATVIPGRMDFVSVLLRLIGMELYKIRRRPMSKVLGTLLLLLAMLVSLVVGIELAINLNVPAGAFSPPCQIHSGSLPSFDCSTLSTTQMEQLKRATLSALSEALRLPFSLELATTQGELNPGIILMIILVGSITGGEMSIGTIRLMFTRGPWRGQFLLAKYGAALVCILICVPIMAIAGVIAGLAFNLLSGVPQSFAFLDGAWIGHTLLYLLATMLNWFMYSVLAIFFSVLGRSTVAGIVGALTWFFAEPTLSNILTVAGNFSLGGVSVLLHALPDYFMGNNARVLQLNQAHYLFGTEGSPQSNLQALIILVVYLAIFIGLTWWLNEKRDVTN